MHQNEADDNDDMVVIVALSATSASNSTPIPRYGFAQQATFGISYFWNRALVSSGLFGMNWIDNHVVLGALPSESHLPMLLNQFKVTTIINLCAETKGIASACEQHQVHHIHLPCIDFQVPSPETLELGVSELTAVANSNKVALAHCKAGRGRSASLVMCYLVATYQMDLMDAQKYLLSKRRQVDSHLSQSVNIRAFYENVNKNNRRPAP
ncbi:hypothetical protein SeLEV6574_g07796 [Synchytrium endobioticum]|uniref:Uncharacterized protein n=1 Tax=Synchytrium endobioticum TaxID=286115 RepID=A0A507CBH8_9FUNG|nr:hypothetical protein SeLEV6574_g07796 [Synchytrium endobioticum]